MPSEIKSKNFLKFLWWKVWKTEWRGYSAEKSNRKNSVKNNFEAKK